MRLLLQSLPPFLAPAFFFATALLGFLFPNVSSAQDLEWSEDTIHFHQIGCEVQLDSLDVNFTNTAAQSITIDRISGTNRWKVANPEFYSSLVILPGATYPVRLYFEAKHPAKDNIDKIILHINGDGTGDTVYIHSVIEVATLVGDPQAMHGPFSWPIGNAGEWTVHQAASGANTIPLIIKEIWIEGSKEFGIKRLGGDTIEPAALIPLYVLYAPVDLGLDTATVFIRTEPCDRLYSYTIVFNAFQPSPPKPRWTQRTTSFSAPNCTSFVASEATLINIAALSVFVDSIKIVDDTAGVFSMTGSNPFNRFNEFVLDPEARVTYSLRYSPPLSNKGPHGAKIVAYMQQGNDTSFLVGSIKRAVLMSTEQVFNLGKQPVGSSYLRTTKLRNYGDRPFVVSEIKIESTIDVLVGEIAKDAILEPDAYYDIQLTFSSVIEGAASGTIHIIGNQCDDTLTLSFNGEFFEPSSVESNTTETTHIDVSGNTFTLIAAEPRRFTYSLFDASGRRMEMGSIGTEESRDISSLPPGFYFLEVQTPEHPIFAKLLRR